MNILFINDCYGWGGGERWVVPTAEKLRERGHNTYVGGPIGGWLHKQASKSGIECFTYIQDDRFSPQLIWLVREFVLEKEIDLILCTILGYRNEAEILTHALREAGRGIIIIKMGLAPWDGITAEHIGYGREDCVKRITVVADMLKREMVETRKEITPDRVQVCYVGVDLSIYDLCKYGNQKNIAKVKNELGISLNNIILATTARLSRVKGIHYLLPSAVQVIKKHPNVTFIIAGDGSEKDQLEEMAHSLKISDHIIFTGFVDDIARLLSAVDLLVHPSFDEGLSNSVMEAMSMAKPVITTDVGGMRELVIHGETGLMIPPMDSERLTNAILELLNDKNRMKAMGIAGRRRVEAHFNRDVQVKVFEDFLQKEVDEAANMNRKPCSIPISQLGLSTEPPDLIFRRSWPRF